MPIFRAIIEGTDGPDNDEQASEKNAESAHQESSPRMAQEDIQFQFIELDERPPTSQVLIIQ